MQICQSHFRLFLKKLKKLAKQLSTANIAIEEDRYILLLYTLSLFDNNINIRFDEGIDKLKSALKSTEDEEAFRIRIEAQLCKGYSLSKVNTV